ncbi:MAG: hypothetical protein J7L45_01615 [Candidatus Aenigmarchaeota archaeon]|nr:hypothetical protein [Candidatus Aenigmarchaeota archaeon]
MFSTKEGKLFVVIFVILIFILSVTYHPTNNILSWYFSYTSTPATNIKESADQSFGMIYDVLVLLMLLTLLKIEAELYISKKIEKFVENIVGRI